MNAAAGTHAVQAVPIAGFFLDRHVALGAVKAHVGLAAAALLGADQLFVRLNGIGHN
jgi:hypothetical protein